MVKIQHKEKHYNIPTEWAELSISKFYQISSLMETSKEQEYDDEYLYSNLFKIITGLKQPEYYVLTVENIIIFKKAMNFMLQPLDTTTFESDFNYAGYKFKVKNFEEFSFGEYIDSQHNLQDSKNVARMYAILLDIYEPKNIWKLKFKDTKLDMDLDKKEKLIGDIPITKLGGLQAFFLRGQKQLGRSTVSYLLKVARQERTKAYLELAGHITYGLWMPVVKNWIKWMKPSKPRLGRRLHS